MSGLPASYDEEGRTRYLRTLAGYGDRPLPVAEAALALGSLDRPHVDLTRYRDHLDRLARDVGRHAGAAGTIGEKVRALNETLLLRYGYAGDELNYDDLQNANLIRVIDRQRGLPVALGILYLHAARAQGWEMAGLAFPGHFLVRLSVGAERLILDPFHRGAVCSAVELRALLRTRSDAEGALLPEHYAPVSDRDVLLRLQNNLKTRLLEEGQFERALAVNETMLLLAPERAELWQEQALLHARLGNLRAAVASLEEFVARPAGDSRRHQAAVMIQRLKSELN
jgi:regulator of sirC expression with transglutaminase-like and TPR domain